MDVFISAKTRKNKNYCFGFVRYKSLQEAEDAISRLNEHVVRGRKLWVSMAKYGKDGGPISNARTDFQKEQRRLPEHKIGQQGRSSAVSFNRTREAAFRDGRRYADVVAGVRKQMEDLKAELEQKVKVIPVTHSINVSEDGKIANLLKSAIIAENSNVINIPQIQLKISECDVKVTGLFSLSPTKLLFVFDCELDAKNAVEIDSPLWNIFDNVRLWCEG